MAGNSPVEFDCSSGTGNLRDRFRRSHNQHIEQEAEDAPADRHMLRIRTQNTRFNRNGLFWFSPTRIETFLFFLIILMCFYIVGFVMWQSSTTSLPVPRTGKGKSRMNEWKFGSNIKFSPGKVISRRFAEGNKLEKARLETRIGVRAPRLALIVGNMEKDPQSLMLITVVKKLKKLGYMFKFFALEKGRASPMWEQLGGRLFILSPEIYGKIDWSLFDGIIVDSVEPKDAVASLMQEPFLSIPIIWIIQDCLLANRLPIYEEMGWKEMISHWKCSFSRANVVVFPNFALPMSYSKLDSGNFYVIPGSPLDVWAALHYRKTDTKYQSRFRNAFSRRDFLVLIVGSSFFSDKSSWISSVAMHSIAPLLKKYASQKVSGESSKFVFLSGTSSDGYDDVLQEIASDLRLHRASLWHYGFNSDVNSILLMADIVLYASSQDAQEFPSLLIRAMAYGIPIVAPDFPILKKYIVNGVHGILYLQHSSDALMSAFSLLISNGKLSKLAHRIATLGRLHAENMLASECITGYAKLLENVLEFRSDVIIPDPVSHLQPVEWEWNLFRMDVESRSINHPNDYVMDTSTRRARKASVVITLEEEFISHENGNETMMQGIPTQQDWEILRMIESAEEYEMVETEELEGRVDRGLDVWDNIYHSARKSEKLKFKDSERDEGELERTGQPVCIYEIYIGPAAWPFLHHGSLYRGLSLSKRALRSKSDDVNAVQRLSLLNDIYYQDILCEIGGMFAIANNIDNIHKRPWIGFQSWHAAGRKVALSKQAERVIEEKIQNTTGEVVYFWIHLDVDNTVIDSNDVLTFWLMCDILNGGHCRTVLQDAFREMYGLPLYIEALPPMPDDGDRWSSMHSWVMPTTSFLEFIMFARMFVDSLDMLHRNSNTSNACLFGSSEFEKIHCYCRVLEILVNVWAYHSGRRMVYIDPHSGSLEEQHPTEQRREFMWAKYFDFTLLKSMDQDLAEAADDGDYPSKMWLWPLTGEVYWQGIYEREREERYRLKMDKKRRMKEKMVERMKHGYKQKPLGL